MDTVVVGIVVLITLAVLPISDANTTTVPVVLGDGSTYNLMMYGNVTANQITNATLSSNPKEDSTTINFIQSGPPNTFETANFTIPKTIIPYGTIPRVLVEGHLLTRQSFTADQTNYYVSFTMHFSTHNVSILFNNQPLSTDHPQTQNPDPTGNPPKAIDNLLVSGVIFVAIIATCVGVLAWKGKLKNFHQ